MKNFTYYILSGLILFANFASAQSELPKEQSEADELYRNGEFFRAEASYKLIIELDPDNYHAVYWLGRTLMNNFKYREAERYFKLVSKNAFEEYPLGVYYYGLTLKLNGDYGNSIVELTRYMELPESLKRSKVRGNEEYDQKALIEKEGCLYAQSQLSKPSRNYKFRLLPSPINSYYNEYAVSIYENDTSIAFTSSRTNAMGNQLDTRTGLSFDDNFRYQLGENGWQNVTKKENFDIVNTVYYDAAGTFTEDKSKYYYSSTDPKSGNIYIYVSAKKDNKWSEPKMLNRQINHPKYESKHPSLSTSGDTLFYVTNRHGGEGGLDIWMSVSAGNDNWGFPVNLGNKVNTPYDEVTPFYYAKDNVLLFASNGHKGFGGTDIFITKSNDFKNTEPVNLGLPFNSSKDDLFPHLGDSYGYLTSNRSGFGGVLNNYTFFVEARDAVVASLSSSGIAARKRKSTGFTKEDAYFYRNLPSEEKLRVNSIINQMVKSGDTFDATELALEDKKYFERLPTEQRNSIQRMASALKSTNLSLNDIALNMSNDAYQDVYAANEVFTQDQYFYSKLPSESRNKVDQIIDLSLATNGNVDSSTLPPALKKYYSTLTESEKSAVGRLAKLRSATVDLMVKDKMFDYDFNTLDNEITTEAKRILEQDKAYLSTLSTLQRDKLEQFVVLKLYQNKVNDESVLQSVTQVLSALPEEEVTRVERIVKVRELGLNLYLEDKSISDKLRIMEEDRIFLQKLSLEDRKRYDQLIAFQSNRLAYQENNLINEDSKMYFNSLDTEKRQRIEKLSEWQISGLILLDDTGLSLNQSEVIKLSLDQQEALKEGQYFFEKLSAEEKELVKALLVAFADEKLMEYQLAISDKKLNYFSKLDSEEKYRIDQMVNARLKGQIILQDGQLSLNTAYNFESDEEKEQINKLLTFLSQQPSMEKMIINSIINEAYSMSSEMRDITLSFSDRQQLSNLPSESLLRVSRIIRGLNSGNLKIEDEKGLLALNLDSGDSNPEISASFQSDLSYINSLSNEERRFLLSETQKVAGSKNLKLDATLDENLAAYFENLPTEDKLRIERMAEVRFAGEKLKQFNNNALLQLAYDYERQAVLDENEENDKLYFSKLSTDERQNINNIIEQRVTGFFQGGAFELSGESKQIWERLSLEEKDRILRQAERQILAIKLAGDNNIIRSGTQLASDESTIIAIAANQARQDQSFLTRLPSDEKEIIEEIITARLIKLNTGKEVKLSRDAQLYFQNLPTDGKDRIDRIVTARNSFVQIVLQDDSIIKKKNKSDEDIYREANEYVADQEYTYSRLLTTDKLYVDQLVDLKIKNFSADLSTVSGEAGVYFSKLKSKDKDRITNVVTMMASKSIALKDDSSLFSEESNATNELAQISTFDVGAFDNINITGILIDDVTGKPASGVSIPLINDKGEIAKTTITENDGSFRYTQLSTDQQYRIQIDSVPLSMTSMVNYRIRDLKITGSTKQAIVSVFDNIYFDVNKTDIRPEAQQILADLVTYYKRNPGIQIEITAYTDTTSTDAYNLLLSKRRGQQIVNYLESNGVDRSAMIISAMGKAKTVKTEDVRYGLQMNRRVEFEIIGANENYISPYKSYLVRPGASLSAISDISGISIDRLKKLNGLSSDILQPYKPFRLDKGIVGLETLLFSIDEYID